MIKNKIDFKLINIAIITLIVFLMYQTGNLWMGVFTKFANILLPFFFDFAVAYALYPFLEFLQSKKIPKGIAVLLIVAIVLAILGVTIGLIVPLLVGQLSSLFNSILVFLKEISMDYDINIGPLQESLADIFNEILKDLGKYVSDGAISFIGVSLNVLANVVIAFSAAVYFLLDMKSIRKGVKKFLLNKDKKYYYYVKELDTQMKKYFNGFVKVVCITLVEYTVAFYIIGHPNALLLGFLAAIANLIPYFGGIFTNIVAAITAFVISPGLFVRTIIAFFILSSLDGYVINPYVYGKTNEMHPVISIFSVFAGGILMGVLGIIISLPLTILLFTTYKFFREDISDKIEDIKFAKK